MRLKNGYNFLVSFPPSRFQRGAYFAGMVGVIVDNGDTALDGEYLEPAGHTLESPQGLGDNLNIESQLQRYGNSSGRIPDIVQARQRDAHPSDGFSPFQNGEFDTIIMIPDIVGTVLGIFADSVSDRGSICFTAQ